MKDVYGRPIYRLERVRGNKARYQNSETAQWTPWLMPTKTEVGFPDKLNERDMAALLYSWSVRRGIKAVARQMREFGKVIRSIGEKVRLEHPEALTKALDEAVARHPAGSKLSRNVTVLPVDDEHPDFGDADEIRDDEVTRGMHLIETSIDVSDRSNVVELALPKSAQRALALQDDTTVTEEQVAVQKHLGLLRVVELRDLMRECAEGDRYEVPNRWSKMTKGEMIQWLSLNLDEEDLPI